MSEYRTDDLEMAGYLLPEDSQFRLVRLGEFIKFLARLAEPRSVDEEREAAPKVRAGELAVCMELLAEQMDMVLREVSWPAQRQSLYSGQDLGGDTVDAPTRGRE
ncbi:XAC0095 family protein [Xanthomonas sp. NCPPB 3005]|uniref:XAC0095 family protein n=1 Tax=Xanthomonas sp. NCPPB 3005 TaxID=3240913 RepID=UPI003511881A